MPPITINIFYMKINSIENASAINVGQNYLADWYNSDKRNQGFGQNYGDDTGIIGTKSYVDDSDMVDSPSSKTSLFPPQLNPIK